MYKGFLSLQNSWISENSIVSVESNYIYDSTWLPVKGCLMAEVSLSGLMLGEACTYWSPQHRQSVTRHFANLVSALDSPTMNILLNVILREPGRFKPGDRISGIGELSEGTHGATFDLFMYNGTLCTSAGITLCTVSLGGVIHKKWLGDRDCFIIQCMTSAGKAFHV